MDQTINLNHNAAQCIKSAEHFGYTTYMNICNGASHDLAWGGMDWLGYIIGGTVLVGIGLGIIGMLVGIAISIITEL